MKLEINKKKKGRKRGRGGKKLHEIPILKIQEDTILVSRLKVLPLYQPMFPFYLVPISGRFLNGIIFVCIHTIKSTNK